MGKKYIIEIPEEKIADFVGSTHFLMPYTMAGHIGYHDTGLPIKPYTEPDLEQIRKEAYEQGLFDAWEAARKIAKLDTDEQKRLFGCFGISFVAYEFSAREAIEKIRQYEQEYRVGDEFENGAGQKFVVLKMDGKEIDRYIDGDGKTYVMDVKYRVMRKMGRSFPEIAAVLEKMRGGQE